MIVEPPLSAGGVHERFAEVRVDDPVSVGGPGATSGDGMTDTSFDAVSPPLMALTV